MQFRKWLETFDVVYSGGGTNPNGPVSVKININAHLSSQLPLPQGEGLGICQTNVLTNRLEEV
jgi:hypothetical protein